MKKHLFPFLAVLAIGFATGCSDDENPAPEPPVEGGEEIVKRGILEADETWTSENIYVLDGRVVVDEGVTLTIEPGTIIKAEDGQEANASALIVDQGGRLLAEGTAAEPIIFTSVNDGIEVGETESTLELADAGQWGGVILLGRAPISVSGQSGTASIEGIPANLSYGTYGGDDPVDEFAPGQGGSKLNFLSIRFSGVALVQDGEIQGLTLGGVGSATSIKNIEIYSNKDDGVEWFGGNVNVENLLVYGQEDDGIDIDQAYSGTISNAYVIQTAQSGSAFEIDGPEGSLEGSFTLRNITVDGGGFDKLLCDLRDNAMGTLENIVITNAGTTESTVNLADPESEANYLSGKITFSNWSLALPEGKTNADMFTKQVVVGQDENGEDILEFQLVDDNAAFLEALGGDNQGANLSVFDWTYTKSQGAF